MLSYMVCFLLQELSREYRMRTPLQEFLLTAAEFGGGRHAELLQQLNVSFDLDFEKRQIHQREQGQTARGAEPHGSCCCCLIPSSVVFSLFLLLGVLLLYLLFCGVVYARLLFALHLARGILRTCIPLILATAVAAGGAPLLHVKAALQLYGASPVAGRRARVAMLRFHRPDLRSSFASASNRKRGAAAAERPWVVL